MVLVSIVLFRVIFVQQVRFIASYPGDASVGGPAFIVTATAVVISCFSSSFFSLSFIVHCFSDDDGHLMRGSYRSTRVSSPNGVTIGSAVYAGFTIVTDRPTNHATPSVAIGRIYS